MGNAITAERQVDSLSIAESKMSVTRKATSARLSIYGFFRKQKKQLQTMLGYPFTEMKDARELGAIVQKVGLNNAGDPFGSLHLRIHSHRFEIAVVEWFAELYELKAEDAWGYVTSGGTESNIQALYTAREMFPTGVLYTSTDSHYSVFKAAKMLRMQMDKIPTTTNGELDYQELERALVKNKGAPAIINATIGTTFYGACDNVEKIVDALRKCDYSENEFYIHCDAALSGLLVPFLSGNEEEAMISFKQPIHSVCTSCHKFLGIPMPCSTLVMRKQVTTIHSSSVSILADARDLTLTCSRNGHAPIYLWYALCKRGRDGIKQEVLKCVREAQFLAKSLQAVGVNAFLHPKSITVILPRPSDTLVTKWQLAFQGNEAHITVMPHITRRMLTAFVADFVSSDKWNS